MVEIGNRKLEIRKEGRQKWLKISFYLKNRIKSAP